VYRAKQDAEKDHKPLQGTAAAMTETTYASRVSGGGELIQKKKRLHAQLLRCGELFNES
jgi:hypothetical protein